VTEQGVHPGATGATERSPDGSSTVVGLADPPRPSTPLLSVVVPVYDVEQYIAECLTSILKQTYTNLEVLVIDDGSTDGSATLAQELAGADRRLRVHRFENGGLGRARNRGTALAQGEYITFVDSDDVLPLGAFTSLVNSLEHTGSDIAIGNVQRLHGSRRSASPQHDAALRRTRLRTHISTDPQLVYDTTAWNKVFRRSFWQQHCLAFAEDVLYEDMSVIAAAHAAATTVDVLGRTTYWWRVREDRSSITQQRSETRNLRDRLHAMRGAYDHLSATGDPARRKFLEKTLSLDLVLYARAVPDADDEYRSLLNTAIRYFVREAGRASLRRLPLADRIRYHLVGAGRFDDIDAVNTFFVENGAALPHRQDVLGRRHVLLPLKGRVPRALTRLDREFVVRSGLSSMRWRDDVLEVSGWAYIRHLPLVPGADIDIELRDGEGGIIRFDMAAREAPEATALSRQERYDYRHAGFLATLPVGRLLAASEGRKSSTWQLHVRVTADGMAREEQLVHSAMQGSLATVPARRLHDGRLVVPVVDRGEPITIQVRRPKASAEAVALEDHRLTVSGRSRKAFQPVRGYARTPTSGVTVAAELARDQQGGFTMTVQLPRQEWGDQGTRRLAVWRLYLEEQDGRRTEIAADVALAEALPREGAQGLSVTLSRRGWLTVRDEPELVEVDHLEVRPGPVLHLRGLHRGMGGFEVAARAVHTVPHVTSAVARLDGDRFAVDVPLCSSDGAGPLLPLPAEPTWVLDAVAADGRRRLVFAADSVSNQLPLEEALPGARVEVTRGPTGLLAVRTHAPLLSDERGKYAQSQLLEKTYAAGRQKGLVDAVVLDSWSGTAVSDSPRAIHAELARRECSLPVFWVVRDLSVPVPDGVEPLVRWSRRYYELMARASHLVNNDSSPPFLRRRDGQTYVQTWHGTPLKRIGHDIETIRMATSGYLDRFAVEVQQWTHLVSPNRYSTDIFRRAFRYDGQVLETGYPRNDALLAPGAASRARAVRERLGIAQDATVLLYAPTWRDDSYVGPGKYRLPLHLDVERVTTALGADHVVLVRGHAVTKRSERRIPAYQGVRDVTTYPDITDLYLVADVLITDYSSTMFDYAVTGKPMYFLTPDLEDYRDRLRGFYFDFESASPGPLVRTTEEVVEAVAAGDGVPAAYEQRYAHFRETFCSLEDGHASERVVDAVFGNLTRTRGA